MSRKKEKREYIVRATVELRGATMCVEAHNADEAAELARSNPDFDVSGAEMVNWDVTGVEENE